MSSDGLLKQATASVSVDGKLKGTAWLVSKDGYLLTAGHLLGTESPRSEVLVQFPGDVPRKAHRIDWGYQKEIGIDYAVLKLESIDPARTALPISVAREVSGPLKVCGYGVTLSDQSIGEAEFIAVFDPLNSESNRLFQISSQQVGEPGYSGGPVFCENCGKVVGIQIEATDKASGAHRDTVLVMPLYRVAARWEKLEQFTGEIQDNGLEEQYIYDILVSYSRKSQIKYWVEQFFVPELTFWLTEKLEGREARLFWNQDHLRVTWAAPMNGVLKSSCLLVSVLTPSYFRSADCLAEWETFRAREGQHQHRFFFPVIWSDGESIPAAARERSIDFHQYAIYSEGFKKMEIHREFVLAVEAFAEQLAIIIRAAPPLDKHWPVVTPSDVRVDSHRSVDRPRL